MSTKEPTASSGARSDAELLAISRGDAAAFGVLFDRHVDSIYGYIVRRVGESLAEDLTAETFARAFSRRDSFVPYHESAGPWLYGIATNLIRKARRAEQRRLAAYARAATTPAAIDHTELVDASLDAHRALPRVIHVLSDLQPVDRDALLLFAWQGLTYGEVGAALGVPTGTVASRVNRARRRIRTALGMSDDDSIGVV